MNDRIEHLSRENSKLKAEQQKSSQNGDIRVVQLHQSLNEKEQENRKVMAQVGILKERVRQLEQKGADADETREAEVYRQNAEFREALLSAKTELKQAKKKEKEWTDDRGKLQDKLADTQTIL